MSHKAAKIGLTGTVLALAFGGLLYSTLGESAQYYKHVDEVMGQPSDWYGKALQVHGFASDIRRKRDSLDYSFEMHNKGQIMRATYTASSLIRSRTNRKSSYRARSGPTGSTRPG